jgi:hypothetical protein
MDSLFEMALKKYHEKLYPSWEPGKRSKNMELFEIAKKEYFGFPCS